MLTAEPELEDLLNGGLIGAGDLCLWMSAGAGIVDGGESTV